MWNLLPGCIISTPEKDYPSFFPETATCRRESSDSKEGGAGGEAESSLWPQLGSSFTGKSGAENERNPLGISLVFHPKLFRALKNMKIKLGLLFKAFPIEAQCEPEICAKGKRQALPEQSSPPEIPTGPSQ